METLIKMLNVFSWIAVIGCPILVITKVIMQYRYEISAEKIIHNMKGVEADYMGGARTLLLVFLIALVYLIVK